MNQNVLWLKRSHLARLILLITAITSTIFSGAVNAETNTTLNKLFTSISQHEPFSKIRSLFPKDPWKESSDKTMNRFYLSADNVFDLSDIPYSIRFADGDKGVHELNAGGRGQHYSQDSCRSHVSSMVGELEKRFGTIKATGRPFIVESIPFTIITYGSESMGIKSEVRSRNEDVSAITREPNSNNIEWSGDLLTEDGVKVKVSGHYFGVATLLGKRNDCKTYFEISNTKSKPRTINTPDTIHSNVRPQRN